MLKKITVGGVVGLLMLVGFIAYVPVTLAASAVVLLAPNGGETYRVGSSLPVAWAASEALTSAEVDIVLRKLKSQAWDPNSSDKSQYWELLGFDYITEGGTTNSGQFTWKIPVGYSTKLGNYVVEITITYQNANGQIVTLSDWSNNYFTIQQATQTSTSPLLTQLTPSTIHTNGPLTITGNNFLSANTVHFFGQPFSTAFSNLPSADGKTIVLSGLNYPFDVGAYTVYVSNANGVSLGLPLTVTLATTSTKPVLALVTPTSVAPGGEITLYGSGFLEDNSVDYLGASSARMYGIKSTDGVSAKFALPTNLAPGQYAIGISNQNGISETVVITVTAAAGPVHQVGTNILGPDGTVYFINTGNTRSPYTSAGAFLSYKFNNWASVAAATGADMALPLTTYTPTGATATTTYYIPPRNGSLINDNGTVYLITNGLRAGFASAHVFLGLGYSFANAYPGDTSFMVTLPPIDSAATSHRNGALINDNGTLYVMTNGTRAGFPSMAVLESWGYWAGEAAPANSYDRERPVSAVVQTRLPSQLSF